MDLPMRKAILIIRCTKPASVFRMPKPFTLSSRSNLRMLCCLQCCHSCATSRHGNGSVGLWRLSHLTHVHSWSNKRTMLLLSYCQLSHGSKPSGTCELWELSDAVDVPIWSTVRQMCGLQFRDISWGLNKHNRTEVQQLRLHDCLVGYQLLVSTNLNHSSFISSSVPKHLHF